MAVAPTLVRPSMNTWAVISNGSPSSTRAGKMPRSSAGVMSMTLIRPNWPGSLTSMVGAGASLARPCRAAGGVAVAVRARLRLVVVFEDEVVFDFAVLVESLLLVRVVARCCTAAILPILKGLSSGTRIVDTSGETFCKRHEVDNLIAQLSTTRRKNASSNHIGLKPCAARRQPAMLVVYPHAQGCAVQARD